MPGMRNWVDFDGWDAATGSLIDKKWNVTGFPKSSEQARRQAEIAKQHGVKVRWVVPANRVHAAEKLVETAGAGETITVIAGN